MVGLVLIASGLAKASIPVIWQADPNGSGVVTNNNSISRVKLTPDNNKVMVFHYNGGQSGIPTRVDKLDASTGNFVWPEPGYKTVTKPGERLSLNGWVDCNGNLYIMGSWSGHTIWKYDPNLDTELCSYTGGSGFEYVRDAIDDCEYLYVAGMTGSSSNQGSRLVKLELGDCNEIWTCLSKNTSDKDDYGRAIALDSSKNVFRVGMDSSFGASDLGRLIGHDANDGSEILNYTVNETNSRIEGITIDSNDYIYIAYCYDYTPTGSERTVVQKLDPNNGTADVIWEYRFDDIGMYVNRNAIVKHTENSFYVAFNQGQCPTNVPGIAEFDLDGNLLWKDTVDRQGWYLSSGIDAEGDYIYMGLTNCADSSQTQVLCLTQPPACQGPVPGDLDNDCYVNFLDFAIFAEHWLHTGNPQDSASGIVAYWSFDEGRGNTVHDYSENGYNGQLDGATWTTGVSGQALSFDEIDDYVGVSNDSNLSFTSPSEAFSTSFWIKPDTIIPITQTILENEDDYFVALYEGVLAYRKSDSGNLYHNSWFSTNPEISAGNWSHVVITYDGTGAGGTKMYVNGEEKPVTNTSYHGGGSASGNNFAIGIRAFDFASEPYGGRIDEVLIYNRALTATEVQYLRENLRIKPPPIKP